jgi:rare lipoprotein A
MKRHLFTLFSLSFALLLFSCTTTTITGPNAPTTSSPPSRTAKVVDTFEGVASWYGPEFHGKKTASGEIFDMTDLTAAHKTLPMGTVCMVTNLNTNKSVTVRVNDRGPFAKERVIDLSYAAADVIGMISTGTAPVRVEVLSEEAPPAPTTTPTPTTTPAPSPNTPLLPETTPAADTTLPTDVVTPPPGEAQVLFTVQVGSFSSKANAEILYNTLAGKYENVSIEEFSTTTNTYWRVRVGKFSTREEAQNVAEKLSSAGYTVFISER